MKRLAERLGVDPARLEGLVRIADETEDRPGWFAIDFPNMTGVWHTRYRNSDPEADKRNRWHQPHGTNVHLYNPLKLGPNADEVWLFEGETDTLTAIAGLGLPAVGVPGIASGGGKSFRPQWRLLFDSAFVVVCFDNEAESQKAAESARRAFKPSSKNLIPPKDGWDFLDWWTDSQASVEEAVWRLRIETGLAKLDVEPVEVAIEDETKGDHRETA